MATAHFSSLAENSRTAGNVSTISLTLPNGIPQGTFAFAVAASSNISEPVMDTAGWAAQGAQSLGSQAAQSWVRVLGPTHSGTAVSISLAAAARLAVGVVLVSGGDSYEVDPPLVAGTGDLNFTVPAATPSAADSMLVALAGTRHAQVTSPTVGTVPGWTTRLESITENTTNAHAGAWAATRQIVGGAGVTVAAASSTPNSNTGEAVWVYRVKPAAGTAASGIVIRKWSTTTQVWV